jgi:hypothetical protein
MDAITYVFFKGSDPFLRLPCLVTLGDKGVAVMPLP